VRRLRSSGEILFPKTQKLTNTKMTKKILMRKVIRRKTQLEEITVVLPGWVENKKRKQRGREILERLVGVSRRMLRRRWKRVTMICLRQGRKTSNQLRGGCGVER
jgi:hypothetical protein